MFDNRPMKNNDEFPPELKSLFSEYRSALPDFDGSPEFMPKLWDKIESRQRFTLSFGRLARGFVTAAAALCMMFSVAVWSPVTVSTSQSADGSGTYVEVLADASGSDDSVNDAASII